MDDLSQHKAKKKVKAALEKQSWDLQSFDSDEDMSVMVYFYDVFKSREFMMAGLRGLDLTKLENIAVPMEAITASIEIAFQGFYRAKSKAKRIKETESLGSTLGLYMVNTKTYRQLCEEHGSKGGYKHFIVLRYKNQHAIESTFRPFSLVSESKCLGPELVHDLALSVVERDEKSNAAYFNFQPVTPIRR